MQSGEGTAAVQLRLMWPHGNEDKSRVAKPDLPRENESTDFCMKYDFQVLAINSLFLNKTKGCQCATS